MKKIILCFLITGTLVVSGHEPISMYKIKKDTVRSVQKQISSARKGCYWLGFSGLTLITTAALNQAKYSASIPAQNQFQTIEDYNTAFDKYNRHQLSYRTSMNASLTITGISVIISSLYFLESKIFEGNQTTMFIKPGVNSISLCLNFD